MELNLNELIDQEKIEIQYQLVISPNKDFAAGVEALTRGIHPEDGSIISPLELFDKAKKSNLDVELEKLIINKALEGFKPIYEKNMDLLLFINVGEHFLEYCIEKDFMRNAALVYNIASHNIVFDINNISIAYLNLAKQFIDHHRNNGFFICLDDIGINYFNIDKTIFLNPDILKINVISLRNMDNELYKENMLKYLKYISDDQGILLVAKGVETKEDVIDSLNHGSQFMQGYFVARPSSLENGSLNDTIMNFRKLIDEFYTDDSSEIESTRLMMAKAINIIKDISLKLEEEKYSSMDDFSQLIFEKYPCIENIWFLNKEGRQMNDTYINHNIHRVKSSPIFQVFNDGSDFSKKEIYRQLTDTMLDIWVTRPYKSILTNNICLGASIYTSAEKQEDILCINLNYEMLIKLINK